LNIFGLLFGPKLLVNAGTLAPRVANWLLKLDAIIFSALQSMQGHKVQHLLVTWGRLKIFLKFQPDSYCKALGDGFNFYTNRNAGFGLNIGSDS
jgi:hypothetical protein